MGIYQIHRFVIQMYSNPSISHGNLPKNTDFPAREKCAAEPRRWPSPRKVRCRARPLARPAKSALLSLAAGPAREKCAAEPGRRPGPRKVRCRARPPARPAKSAPPSLAAGLLEWPPGLEPTSRLQVICMYVVNN